MFWRSVKYNVEVCDEKGIPINDHRNWVVSGVWDSSTTAQDRHFSGERIKRETVHCRSVRCRFWRSESAGTPGTATPGASGRGVRHGRRTNEPGKRDC